MGDRAGHAPHHAARFILRDHTAAGGDDFTGAAGAVGTHAGEHDGEIVRAPDFGRRSEQRIDGRLAEIDRRPVVEHDRGRAVAAHDAHVPPAGREIDASGAHRLAIHRLADRPAASARQMLGQNRGEGPRHVLHDQHRSLVDDAVDVG